MSDEAKPITKCLGDDKWNCPNMEADPDDMSMESERYRCLVCGERYKLYYEDMQ